MPPPTALLCRGSEAAALLEGPSVVAFPVDMIRFERLDEAEEPTEIDKLSVSFVMSGVAETPCPLPVDIVPDLKPP